MSVGNFPVLVLGKRLKLFSAATKIYFGTACSVHHDMQTVERDLKQVRPQFCMLHALINGSGGMVCEETAVRCTWYCVGGEVKTSV